MGFDEFADRYDAWFLENEQVLGSELLLVKAALGTPGRTLSVGCGSGLFESILAREHGIVIGEGIEPSAGMAEIARQRGVDVQIAPAESIPHDDAAFDTVLMNGIPAYVGDLAAAFAEAFRVLKPGGTLVVADVPASSSYGLLYQLAAELGDWQDTRLSKVAPACPYPLEFAAAANWRTTDELLALLEAAGFAFLASQQTLTTHARFSNDAVEEPSPGHDKGGYVALRARRPA